MYNNGVGHKFSEFACFVSCLQVYVSLYCKNLKIIGPHFEKPVFEVSDKAMLKPAYLALDTNWRYKISYEASLNFTLSS